ncbi:hypothetical protein WR25_14667 isoform B [Diploscapter pachys]|uniref:Uncharacterized protein n=1 Tax=Diploscapter pachys TaxID=2018661 RepID=A0A2A2LJI7_9BILA|nr:hypothetical protein WR25_14667 isoform B [Diploscapter pachys]
MDPRLEELPDYSDPDTPLEATTNIPPPCGDDYSNYLLVLVLFILCLALVMCLARILFMYCGYKRRRFEQPDDDRETARRQETEEITGHPFSYLATEAGRVNYGFVDPPPRYDQLFKDNAERTAAGSAAIDQAPPTYDEHVASARSNASANSAAHISVSNISSTVAPSMGMQHAGANSPIDIESPHASDIRRAQTSQGSNSSQGRIPQGAFGTSIPNFSLATDRSRAGIISQHFR